MSTMTVLSEESLGLVAGGRNKCDRPPSQNHAELYAWSSYCANLNGGTTREWYLNGYDTLTAQQPKKQPKKP